MSNNWQVQRTNVDAPTFASEAEFKAWATQEQSLYATTVAHSFRSTMLSLRKKAVEGAEALKQYVSMAQTNRQFYEQLIDPALRQSDHELVENYSLPKPPPAPSKPAEPARQPAQPSRIGPSNSNQYQFVQQQPHPNHYPNHIASHQPRPTYPTTVAPSELHTPGTQHVPQPMQQAHYHGPPKNFASSSLSGAVGNQHSSGVSMAGQNVFQHSTLQRVCRLPSHLFPIIQTMRGEPNGTSRLYDGYVFTKDLQSGVVRACDPRTNVYYEDDHSPTYRPIPPSNAAINATHASAVANTAVRTLASTPPTHAPRSVDPVQGPRPAQNGHAPLTSCASVTSPPSTKATQPTATPSSIVPDGVQSTTRTPYNENRQPQSSSFGGSISSVPNVSKLGPNKSTLARDVLSALGLKRESSVVNDERAPKKRAIEADNRPVVQRLNQPNTKSNSAVEPSIPDSNSQLANSTAPTQLKASTVQTTKSSPVKPDPLTSATVVISNSNTSTKPNPYLALTTMHLNSSGTSLPRLVYQPHDVQMQAAALLSSTVGVAVDGAPGPSTATSSAGMVSTSQPPSVENPLFLPSSPVVPDTPLADDDVQIAGEDGREPLNSRVRRRVVQVLIPPPPEWVRNHQLKAKQQQEAREISPEIELSLVPNVLRQLALSTGESDEEEALDIALSRMRKMRCKWSNCGIVLNSVERLHQHALQHDMAVGKWFCCLWKHCEKTVPEKETMELHLASHILKPILCAYKGCERSFLDARHYVMHTTQKHQNDELRPSSNPVFIPALPQPNVPSILPSYMSVTRSIGQRSISKERHNTVGVWVWKNIWGNVNVDWKRTNIRSSLSPERLRKQHGYDYLDELPPASTQESVGVDLQELDYVHPDQATKLFQNGLVLWPGNDAVKEETEETEEGWAEVSTAGSAAVDPA